MENFKNIEIPVLIFDGNKEDLANIFKAVNTSGTSLSAYDVLNAYWGNKFVNIQEREIIKAIKERYSILEDEGFCLEEKEENKFNLYEYLLGLGKYILGNKVIPNIDFMFPKKRKADKVDAIFFSIASVCHGLHNQKMINLPEVMPRLDDIIRIDLFQTALIDSTKWTVKCLQEYLDYKLSGDRGTVAHSELQLASIIARVLVGMYDVDNWGKKANWKREEKALKRNIPQYYLFDILKKNWSGAGDSRLFNLVWDTANSNLGTQMAPSDHYLKRLSKEQLSVALDEYFEESLRERSSERRNAKPADKLLLKIAYREKIPIKEVHRPHEIEHLMPVSVLKKCICEDEGWPINSIGNLAILDKKTNREKKAQTINQFIKKNPKEEARIRKYVFLNPEKIDVRDIKKYGLKHYERFLRKNFNKIKLNVLKNLYL